MQATRLLNIYHSLYVHWMGFKAALYRHKYADVTKSFITSIWLRHMYHLTKSSVILPRIKKSLKFQGPWGRQHAHCSSNPTRTFIPCNEPLILLQAQGLALVWGIQVSRQPSAIDLCPSPCTLHGLRGHFIPQAHQLLLNYFSFISPILHFSARFEAVSSSCQSYTSPTASGGCL